ncbi:Gfo/Idh/MocA family oxidoreductase [Fodinisporobacter ferrooxydans]|uniref:Gfo/Idh/MocA family oxidoreductase n=1 Tax=Fodinisporobacter ferrooxydans TaxID=2901836 RepID=A0ABY4CHK0_9BACL|nr:Gfo/Idh/MocA family oxidoreductase [Alicyclobacillaceae bacterium MYW30-H2]
MSNDSEIRIGLIGAGNIGKVHLEVFEQVKGASIVAIHDAFLPLAEQRAQQYGIQNVHDRVENLIHDDRLDAVIIGVPNTFHAPLAIQALEASKHVLLEKPMALNSAAAKDIVRAERASGKIAMIAHQMRWQWNTIQLKEQIEKGALGSIYGAKTGWLRRKGIPGWGTWFTRNSESGGGPLIDLGVHMLDLALYLMGNPKPISVSGSTFAEFGPRKKGIGTWGKPDWNGYFDVEDLAMAFIKMDDGSTLSLDVSWAVHMDTDNQPFVHLMGSEGGASIVGNSAKLLTEIFDRAVDVPLNQPADDEGDRVRLSRHFIECIRECKTPISSVLTGLANNLIIDAIFESSRSGKEVVLDWNI